jgi:hypothetical protein
VVGFEKRMISPPPGKLNADWAIHSSSKSPIVVLPRGLAGTCVLVTTGTKGWPSCVPPFTVVRASAMSRPMSKSFTAPRSKAIVSLTARVNAGMSL